MEFCDAAFQRSHYSCVPERLDGSVIAVQMVSQPVFDKCSYDCDYTQLVSEPVSNQCIHGCDCLKVAKVSKVVFMIR